jgi:uncharacterized protein with HEPN domain
VTNEEKPVKMGFERQGAEAQVRLGDCLWDAHAAGMKILEFTAGRSFEEYRDSELLRSVVEKMLEIMIEALVEMRRHFSEEFTKLDGGSRLIEARDADGEVWQVVKDVVPEMVAQLQTMLDEWHQA